MENNIFILILNNGESYEDYSEWIEGVFVSYDAAFLYLNSKNLPVNCWHISIEEWNIAENKKVKDSLYRQC